MRKREQTEREAAALRANLLKRKARQRAKTAGQADGAPPVAADPPADDSGQPQPGQAEARSRAVSA